MDTLRSPKTLPGPSFGIPALTFRGRFTARHGDDAWNGLYKIVNRDWQDYLGWLQRILDLPITHHRRVTAIRPTDGLLELAVDCGTMLTRRVVLATGRAGAGGLEIPDSVDPALFSDLAAHASAPIGFAALRGKRIALIGGGASAWDNAATALELGAARVDMYIRRPVLPQVNKFRAITGPGYVHGWETLPVPEKWRLMVYLFDRPAPVPHETVHRALRQPNLHIHLGTPTRVAARRNCARCTCSTSVRWPGTGRSPAPSPASTPPGSGWPARSSPPCSARTCRCCGIALILRRARARRYPVRQ